VDSFIPLIRSEALEESLRNFDTQYSRVSHGVRHIYPFPPVMTASLGDSPGDATFSLSIACSEIGRRLESQDQSCHFVLFSTLIGATMLQ